MSVYLNNEAERAAVKALGEDIGFGRIIQLAHRCWDEMLEAKHGIKNHSEGWTLASADLIRERRAATASPSERPALPRETVKSDVPALTALPGGGEEQSSAVAGDADARFSETATDAQSLTGTED